MPGDGRSIECLIFLTSISLAEILYMSHTFNQASLASEQVVSSSSMLRWFDKAFPVQPHEGGIPWFIQLYFCQTVYMINLFW